MQPHISFRRAAPALCILLLSGIAQAQQPEAAASATDLDASPSSAVSDTATSARPDTAQGEEIRVDDEVIVTGERSLNRLVARAGRLTLDFYDLLNTVIDEREFRINCQLETRPGSNIRQRVCRPRYVENEQARQASGILNGIVSTDEGGITWDGTYYETMPGIMAKQVEFHDRILRAVNEDPTLNRAFWELYSLKQEIDIIREMD